MYIEFSKVFLEAPVVTKFTFIKRVYFKLKIFFMPELFRMFGIRFYFSVTNICQYTYMSRMLMEVQNLKLIQ